MQGTQTTSFACPHCGHPAVVERYESANADLDPTIRQAVLDTRFMRGRCESCGATPIVETELLYTELSRGWFVGVFPRSRRHEADALASLIEKSFQSAAGDRAPRPVQLLAKEVRRRIVFGYDELREKVLCSLHSLDDRAIEVSKFALLLGSPEMAARAPGGLTLIDVDPQSGDLLFRASEDEVVGVARSHYDRTITTMETWQAAFQPLFEHPHVNLARCGVRYGQGRA